MVAGLAGPRRSTLLHHEGGHVRVDKRPPPPLLRCNVPLIKAHFQEMQFLHAKVKLEGTSELPHAPLETQMTRTQLEGHRALASCSWFPEGSAEVPRAYGDMWACSVGVAWS